MHRTQLLLLLRIPTIWHCVHLLMSAFTLCCILGYPRTTGRIHTAAMSPSSGCCIKTEDSFSMIPASAFPLLFTWLMQCGGSCSFCQSIHLNILHGFSQGESAPVGNFIPFFGVKCYICDRDNADCLYQSSVVSSGNQDILAKNMLELTVSLEELFTV